MHQMKALSVYFLSSEENHEASETPDAARPCAVMQRRGFVEAHDGHYQDALVNKKNEVEIIVHETLGGGFSPSAVNAIFRYKRTARAGFDNTKYRKSTKHISYLAHHTQSISTAITREDSRAMHEALSKKMAELSRHRPGGRA